MLWSCTAVQNQPSCSKCIKPQIQQRTCFISCVQARGKSSLPHRVLTFSLLPRLATGSGPCWFAATQFATKTVTTKVEIESKCKSCRILFGLCSVTHIAHTEATHQVLTQKSLQHGMPETWWLLTANTHFEEKKNSLYQSNVSLPWQNNKSKEHGSSNACSIWTSARPLTASYMLFPQAIKKKSVFRTSWQQCIQLIEKNTQILLLSNWNNESSDIFKILTGVQQYSTVLLTSYMIQYMALLSKTIFLWDLKPFYTIRRKIEMVLTNVERWTPRPDFFFFLSF